MVGTSTGIEPFFDWQYSRRWTDLTIFLAKLAMRSKRVPEIKLKKRLQNQHFFATIIAVKKVDFFGVRFHAT